METYHSLSATTQMSQKQRDLFSKGMVDLANIIAGALVFGQLVSGQVVDMGKIVLGHNLAKGDFLAK
jgi:hypothetical protein